MIDAYLLTATGDKRPVQQLGVTLTIHRQEMHMGPNGPVAYHRRHSWQIANERFLVMKIDCRVTVRLESATDSRVLGPFDELWIVDGMILSDLDQDQPIADFSDADKFWHFPADGTAWERVMFTEA